MANLKSLLSELENKADKSKLAELIKDLKKASNRAQALSSKSFFKTAPGEYGSGDIFLGITVPQQRKIVKNYLTLSFKDLEKLLASPIHEFRFSALLILLAQYQQASNFKEHKNIVAFYLKNISRINNWDLVDLSAPKILGDFLWREAGGTIKDSKDNKTRENKTRENKIFAWGKKIKFNESRSIKAQKLLSKLASSRKLWERRIAIVATFAFIKNGQADLTFNLAKQLLKDKEDLINKAVGWMLREVGRRVSEEKLLNFLNENCEQMSRTTLRYALERFSPKQRKYYLQK